MIDFQVIINNTDKLSIILELELDINSRLGTRLTRDDIRDNIQAVLAAGTLNRDVLKNILQTILNPGTSADDDPGREP